MERADPQTGIIGGGVIAEDPRSQDLDCRIAQRSDHLYRIKLVRRFLLAWAFPGNLVLVASTASVFLLGTLPVSVGAVLVVGTAGSLVSSGRLLYRQHFRVRAVQTELRELRRAHHENLVDELDSADLLCVQKRYRAELPYLIKDYRLAARRHRWTSHTLQCVVLVGSILTASVAAASVSFVDARWAAVVLSLLVAISSALSAYAKYQERGMTLLRTADELEREYESVELRVGRYRKFSDEREAYAAFADAVETLRTARVGDSRYRGTLEL